MDILDDYKRKYCEWCESEYFDTGTRRELLSIKDNELEIKERFYKELEFGTGGLRGIIGNGTNRINIYTIRKVTQGLANYICKKGGQKKGVVIAYDSRRMSRELAEETALCLCGNGIKAYVFPELRPTPELSFAVRMLKCMAGVVITASHNPAEYNGYKVYGEDGGQITSPQDKEIISEVKKVAEFNNVKTVSREQAIAQGLYCIIKQEVDDAYMSEVMKQSVLEPNDKDIKIVYTPLHGTGNLPVRRVLKKAGFSQVYIVPEQELPDSDFSTVRSPNPEDPKAFELALRLAIEKDADIILATDPDADRLGVYAKDIVSGKFVSFTGNMSGMLIAEYILSNKSKRGELPKNGAMVKTIVTTEMARAIAKEYNVKLIEVLTGFKYIGEQIRLFEQNKSYEFIFGLEESYGCLAGTYARDKDAIVAVLLLCEATAYYKSQGLSLVEKMQTMYEKYGYYKEGLETITCKGIAGEEKIKNQMNKLRENPPKNIGRFLVHAYRDYYVNERREMKSNLITRAGLPESNVLYYELDNSAWVCVRPSGTEPKIKLYFGVRGTCSELAEKEIEELKSAFIKLLEME